MTRVYICASMDELETLAARGSFAAERAYAATERLAADYPDADQDELSYAAMMAAAEDASGPPRIVVATDTDVVEVADSPGVVRLYGDVRITDVASFHVGSDADDDLAWYATQELSDLIAVLGS